MSNITHYKKLERRHCETITFCSMIVLLKNFYKLRDYLATDRMKHLSILMKSPVHITRNPHHPVLCNSIFKLKIGIDSEFGCISIIDDDCLFFIVRMWYCITQIFFLVRILYHITQIF